MILFPIDIPTFSEISEESLFDILGRSPVLRLEVSGSSTELVDESLLAFLIEDRSGILCFSLFFCSKVSKFCVSSEPKYRFRTVLLIFENRKVTNELVLNIKSKLSSVFNTNSEGIYTFLPFITGSCTPTLSDPYFSPESLKGGEKGSSVQLHRTQTLSLFMLSGGSKSPLPV